MKTAEKVLDILGKPINFDVLLASLLTSFVLLMTNFLSGKYLVKFHLEKFLNNYNPYILLLFFEFSHCRNIRQCALTHNMKLCRAF